MFLSEEYIITASLDLFPETLNYYLYMRIYMV